MENQHRQITGYRELSQQEIDLMNEIKAAGPLLDKLVEKVRKHIAQQQADAHNKDLVEEEDRLQAAQPGRWAAIGATHLQEGLMALTRAVAQPTFF